MLMLLNVLKEEMRIWNSNLKCFGVLSHGNFCRQNLLFKYKSNLERRYDYFSFCIVGRRWLIWNGAAHRNTRHTDPCIELCCAQITGQGRVAPLAGFTDSELWFLQVLLLRGHFLGAEQKSLRLLCVRPIAVRIHQHWSRCQEIVQKFQNAQSKKYKSFCKHQRKNAFKI